MVTTSIKWRIRKLIAEDQNRVYTFPDAHSQSDDDHHTPLLIIIFGQ